MKTLSLRDFGSASGECSILCLGAHCDDIEIGCAGSLVVLKERLPKARFTWATFCSNPERQSESEEAARRLLGEHVTLRFWRFRDGYLPYLGGEVKDAFEELKRELAPDLIFTHARHDRHQDHRLVSELTGNTYRNHVVLEYEIPKYDADLGAPNVFVPLSEQVVDTKIRTLIDVYATQAGRQWFDADTLRGLLRLRGVESASPTRFAEAFYCRKLTLG
jgi:LmbE family N-acetylglucosaminyl deacetylase